MSRTPRRKYRYPWRKGNRFELLVDGSRFFPRMLADISAARRHVLLEMYLFESGAVTERFIAALLGAAGRGVDVRLMLDDFGALRLVRADRDRLAEGGVQLAFYNPFSLGKLTDNLARDHRKLLLVDGGVAYTGGAGITDEFDPSDPATPAWRETMVRIEGPVIADWQASFAALWRRVSRSQQAQALQPADAQAFQSPGSAGRVTLIRGPATQEIKRSLLRQISVANERIWFSTAYFVPSWRIRRALRHAAQRGIDVRLLLSGPLTDHPAVRYAGRRFYARMLASGVRIFEYQPRVLHHKIAICDHWVTIGSCNFDRWNLRWNLDANQEIDDADFAAQVMAMFRSDFTECAEVRHEEWHARPWLSRLAESWWGRIDVWLNRLGRGARDRD
jgi:cardiolipin synthase A/B